MSVYRLFSMDSGRIVRIEEVRANDDGAAIAAGKRVLDGKPIEIWLGTRKVHRLETAKSANEERFRQYARNKVAAGRS